MNDVPGDKVGLWIADQIEARGSEGSSVNLDEKAMESIRAITRTGSDEKFFTTQTSESLDLIDLDVFQADARFDDVTGTGYSVVVLDIGLDVDHSFFGSASGGVSDRLVYQYDFVNDDSDISTANSHGSNVTSIIASENGTYPGVAPDVDIIHLKVLSDAGSASWANIEAALDWVVDNASAYNIAAVNMSFGGGNYTTEMTSGISDELAALVNMDVIVASASGNSFYTASSVQGVMYPAADANSLSIGAAYDANVGGIGYASGAIDYTTDAERIASFSQRHSTLTTVMAPGTLITGAGINNGTVTMAGTSQASPHVAGMAVLAQELAMDTLGRRLTQAEFAEMLQDTGTTVNDGDDENDNVTNTNLDFQFVNMFDLAEAIEDMVIVVDADSAGANGTDNGNDDTFLVERNGDNVDIFVNSTLYKSVRADWLESITINGSSDDDTVTIEDLGSDFTGTVTAYAGTGTDSANIYDSSGNDEFQGNPTEATMDYGSDASIEITVNDFRYVAAYADNGGTDTVYLYDSPGDDRFIGAENYTEMSSDTFYIIADDFEEGYGYAENGGSDIAFFRDGVGDDTFTATPEYAEMEFGSGRYAYAEGFVTINAYGGTGNNVAVLEGSSSDDLILAASDSVRISNGDGTLFRAYSFETITIDAKTGSDTALLFDSSGDDTLTVLPTETTLEWSSTSAVTIQNVEEITVFSDMGGNDTANIYDSSGNDEFQGNPTEATMDYGGDASIEITVNDFRYVVAYADNGGTDTVYLYDSPGDDLFIGAENYTEMSSDTFYIRADDFEEGYGYAENGGADIARFRDGVGDDTFTATPEYAEMEFGSGRYAYAEGFGDINAYVDTGNNVAILEGSSLDDSIWATPDFVKIHNGDGTRLGAFYFDTVTIDAKAGSDFAVLYDSFGDDTLTVLPTEATLEWSPTNAVTVQNVEEITVVGSSEGNDSADFYDSAGNDIFTVGIDEATMDYGSGGVNVTISGFDEIYADFSEGGNDTCNITGSTGDDDLSTTSSSLTVDFDAAILALHFVMSGLGSGDTVNADGNDGDDDDNSGVTLFDLYLTDWS